MVLYAAITVFMLFVCAFGAGAAAMRMIDRRRALPQGATVLFSLGLGLGILGHLTLLLGLAGLAKWSGWLLLGAALAVAPWTWRPLFAELNKRVGSLRLAALGGVDLALAACLMVVGILTFLSALTPPFLYDVLEYHIAGPLRWLRTGTVGLFPGNVYANMPCETEMLYTAAMSALSSAPGWVAQRAPGVIHWMFGAGSLAVMWAIMKRLSVRTTIRLLALLLVALHPVVFSITYGTYVDFAVMFWAGLALLALLDTTRANDGSWERGRPRPQSSPQTSPTIDSLRTGTSALPGKGAAPIICLALSSIFFGLALSAKLTVVSLYIVPAAVILVPAFVWKASPDRRAVRFVRAVAFGILIVGIVFFPWLIRGWIATGNPFFPALSGLFPTPYWSAEQTRAFLQYHGQTFPWRLEYWASLVKRFHQPGYWAMLPCLFLIVSKAVLQLRHALEHRVANGLFLGARTSSSALRLPLQALIIADEDVRAPRDGRGALALWAAAAYAIWCLALNSADRFILPALMAAAPASAAIFSDALERRRWRVAALWLILAACALPGAGRSLYEWVMMRPWSALADAEAGRLWQSQAISPSEAARAAFWAGDRLPKDARLLLVFESRFALFDCDFEGNTLFDRSALIEALAGERIESSNDIRAILRRKGFTHVLINDNDLRLFINLFTGADFERALERARRSGRSGAPPVEEDFHIPFKDDPRYGRLRKPLLQFLRECRENHVHAETDAKGFIRVYVSAL